MLPELLQRQAHRLLDKFCQERVPCERFHGLRLGYSMGDNQVTLFEERLAPAAEDNWLRTPIARFVYSPEQNQWLLFSLDKNLCWQIDKDIAPSLNLKCLIEALDNDPNGRFWG